MTKHTFFLFVWTEFYLNCLKYYYSNTIIICLTSGFTVLFTFWCARFDILFSGFFRTTLLSHIFLDRRRVQEVLCKLKYTTQSNFNYLRVIAEMQNLTAYSIYIWLKKNVNIKQFCINFKFEEFKTKIIIIY